LGEHVLQKGSNITAERLRFDFSHPDKMTDEQIKEVEGLVNKKVDENLPVEVQEMPIDEAKKSGALGVFDDRYGNRVKVYSIGDPSAGSGQVFSREICGGPHASTTRELGHFKITNETSSSAGVRRIKAILE
jgi:alanyl-tRNA synthetase